MSSVGRSDGSIRTVMSADLVPAHVYTYVCAHVYTHVYTHVHTQALGLVNPEGDVVSKAANTCW